jgi:hypothetical protein
MNDCWVPHCVIFEPIAIRWRNDRQLSNCGQSFPNPDARMAEMIAANHHDSLSALTGAAVEVSNSGAYPEPGAASVQLLFSEGSRLRADYWRIVKGGRAGVSSFDHDQKFGFPSPIDSFRQLEQDLNGRRVTNASLDARTCDLHFRFDGDVELQVFGFTSYEVGNSLPERSMRILKSPQIMKFL